MNNVSLMGRLTRDPVVRYVTRQDGTSQANARFTLAVDRRIRTEGGQNADFIGCVCFGKAAEWVDKYLSQGIKIAATGRIQTGSYTNREGQKVYTTDVILENLEFAESKAANEGHRDGTGTGGQQAPQPAAGPAGPEGFMQIPDSVEDEGLPFN